jgi:hypothetical protein
VYWIRYWNFSQPVLMLRFRKRVCHVKVRVTLKFERLHIALCSSYSPEWYWSSRYGGRVSEWIFSTCETVPLTRLNNIFNHQENFIEKTFPVAFVTIMLLYSQHYLNDVCCPFNKPEGKNIYNCNFVSCFIWLWGSSRNLNEECRLRIFENKVLTNISEGRI